MCGERDDRGAQLFFDNQSGSTLDVWRNNYSDGRARASFLPDPYGQDVGSYRAGSQLGDSVAVGFGSAPDFRRVASVQFNLFQLGDGAYCGIQATATVWSSS